MNNIKDYTIEEYAVEIAKNIKDHPYDFVLNRMTYYDEETQSKLEQLLLEIIPDLVITHSLTDTVEDKKAQLERTKLIYSNNRYPYFMDFKLSQDKIKKLTK